MQVSSSTCSLRNSSRNSFNCAGAAAKRHFSLLTSPTRIKRAVTAGISVTLLYSWQICEPGGIRSDFPSTLRSISTSAGATSRRRFPRLEETSGAVTHTDNKPGQNTKDEQSCQKRDEQEEHRFFNHVYTDHHRYRSREDDER